MTPKEAMVTAEGIDFTGADGKFRAADVEFQKTVNLVVTLKGHDTEKKTIIIPAENVKETIEMSKSKVIFTFSIMENRTKNIHLMFFSVGHKL